MAATATYFQGGDFVELLSAQGKAPAATWKLQGKITKSFEKLIKGNAFLLDGSADTKMQLPKATQSAALGLTQRFLVVQLLVPFTKSFSVEIGFTDFQKVRRRFVVASAFRETTVTALHAQIPLAAAEIDRDQWINLVFDLQTLTDKYFPGTVFRSMESLCISGSCRLKRVFTMKDPPTPSLSSTGEVVAPSVHTVDIPRQFVFSSSAGVGPVPTQYFASMGQQPASDLSSGAVVVGQAKAAEKRTVDSGKPVKVGKGRAAGPTERKPVETENTKAVSARRAGKVPAPVARGVRVASMANKQDEETTTPRTVLANVRSDVEEPLDHSQSPKRPNIVDNNDDFYPTKRPASSLSSRPSTSTRVSKVDLHEGLNDPSALRPSSGSRSRPSALTRASRDGSPDRLDNSLAQRPSSGLHSRPATAAGTPLLSSIMVEEAVLNRSPSPNKSKMMNSKQKSPQGHSRPLRSSSARSSRQSIGMAAPLPSSIMIDELEARAGQMPPDRVRSSPSPTARARSPAKMQRREIFSQIQQRLSLMSADNDRESARNQELFLQHSTLHRSSEDDLAFDDNSSRYHATTVDRGERPDLPDNSSLAREHAPVAKRIGGGGGYTRAVSAESSRPSIFSFESDARRGQSSRTSDDDDYLMAMKRKRLFDFDSLLDSIDGQSSMLDATSNTAADNRPSLANSDQDDEQQMNDAPLMPGATEYRSSDVDDNASGHMEIDEHDDVEEESTSDRELEQLLAAKRAARQHQQPIVPRPQQDEGGHAEDGPSLDDLDDLDASDSDANKTTEPRSIWHFDEAVATSNEVGAQEERLGPNDSDLCPPDQEDADEDDNLELSMDLTGELDADDADDSVSAPPESSTQQDPNATRSPVGGHSRDAGTRSTTAVVSTSFDFGDLTELDTDGGSDSNLAASRGSATDTKGIENNPQVTREQDADRPLPQTTTMKSLNASFDFFDAVSEAPALLSPSPTTSASTSKRLQRLLESTEWSSLTDQGASTSSAAPTAANTASSRPAATKKAEPLSTSIELVYDPVLRCYYDPVADKYYTLASE